MGDANTHLKRSLCEHRGGGRVCEWGYRQRMDELLGSSNPIVNDYGGTACGGTEGGLRGCG